ncbi:MAG: zinc-binding dehydrogenase [Candidatus Tectimicrobiota bacterium]
MTTPTMQAALLTAPRSLRVVSMPLPEPGAHEVRIRLEGCGVCASNLPVWEGRPWFSYPLAPGAPGHEGWGSIEALGPAAHGLSVGERVAVLSSQAYATHAIVPAEAVVTLPPRLDGVPFPGEALGCALNIMRRSAIQPGQTVAILGIGFLGALLTRLVTQAGAQVIAISQRDYALQIAQRYGAMATLHLQDPQQVQAQVHTLTHGAGCDRVIEAVGLQEPLALAAELTRVRGRLIIAGYHQDGMRQVNMQLWNWRGFDVINAHERDPAVIREGVSLAIEAVCQGTLDPTPLYTHTAPLARLSELFTAMQHRPPGFLKACLLL